jgi:hypothetical protein
MAGIRRDSTSPVRPLQSGTVVIGIILGSIHAEGSLEPAAGGGDFHRYAGPNSSLARSEPPRAEEVSSAGLSKELHLEAPIEMPSSRPSFSPRFSAQRHCP